MRKIAILGGGYSGAMVLVNLLRTCPERDFKAYLIDPGTPARGLAYSTPHECHLLNVPAFNMSALEDDPDHFRRWAGLDALAFAPRKLYGQYLSELLDEATTGRHEQVEHLAERVHAVRPQPDGTLRVELGSGRILAVDQAVLAVGNFLHRVDGRDPWGNEPPPTRGDVLVVGTGLTMVDLCLQLEERGFTGRILALSRHGRLPASHRLGLSPLEDLPIWRQDTLRNLFRTVRKAAEAAERRQAGGWRTVIDSLRASTASLWQGFSDADKGRFLRHVAGLWDTRRHRMAPEVSRKIERMRCQGRLVVMAGRLLEHHDGLAVFQPRGTNSRCTLPVEAVYNCTGLDMNLRTCSDPLVRQLREDGVIRPDARGLGLETDSQGRVLGTAWPHLLALGNLRKGQLWESTAVPELRGQALKVARSLAGPPLEEWLEQLAAALVSARGPREAVDRCQALMAEPLRLPESCLRSQLGQYARHLVQRHPAGHTVVAMVWGPGQGTSVHDHDHSWCVEVCLSGRLRIVNYRHLGEAEDGRVRLREEDSTDVGVGSVGRLIPPLEHHRIHNPFDETAVTLHVYGKELHECTRFVAEEGELYRPERVKLSYTPAAPRPDERARPANRPAFSA